MHVIETRIDTPNASKYLQQLCKHWSHKFTVEFTPEKGRVPFGDHAACDMEADAEALTLRIEALDAASAQRLGEVVMVHLKRFSFREELPDASWVAA